MSASASVLIHAKPVPVTADASVDAPTLAAALDCVPFKDWVVDMDPELDVRSIHVQSVDKFGPRIGFMKFKTETFFHGRMVPGIVFMRGGAVAILVVLRCGDESWVLCCRQPRVPCGQASFLEIPAGMLDGSGNFSGVAAKEMEEETGIMIGEEDLVDMTELAYGQAPLSAGTAAATTGAAAAAPAGTDAAATGVAPAAAAPAASGGAAALRGVYPSVGACDEFLRLLYYTKTVTPGELADLRGKATGLLDHGECITLDLVPLDDLWRRAPDGKTLAAVLLYEKLKAAGKLPLA